MNRRRLRRFVQSEKWFWSSVAASVLAVVVFVLNVLLSEVSPGSAWGLSYGIAAAVLLVLVAAWGVRRRTMRIRSTGKAQSWVQLHVYGGWLFLLLVLMHDGFRWPHGSLNAWLLVLAIWVTATGLIGVFLQKWVPRMLTSGTSVEVLYERVPELVDAIRAKAEELVQSSPEPVQDFYVRNVAPALRAPKSRWVYYIDVTGGIQSRTKQFAYLRRLLAHADQEKLDQLERFYRTKLEMDAHFTLQKSLRWWLYAHLPVSLVLLILTAIHVVSVIIY